MRNVLSLAAACAIVALHPAIVRADISVRLTNAQLTATSEIVLIGRAVSSQSRGSIARWSRRSPWRSKSR